MRSVKIVNDAAVLGKMHPEVPVRGACRRMQLEAGKPPKQRSPIYAKLDGDLCQTKMSFSLQDERIFCDVFPYNVSVGLWQFRVAAEHCLARVSYLQVN